MILLYSIGLCIRSKFSLEYGDIMLLFYFFLLFTGLALIEMYYKPKIIYKNYPHNVNKNITRVIMLVVFAFFLLNIKTIFLAISNPRMFYANSRIGGGFLYLIIIPFVILLYFIKISRLNYNQKKSLIIALFLTFIVFVFLYIFGQKGTLITVCFLFLSTYYYKTTSKNKNVKLIRMGLVFAVSIGFVFVLYSKQQMISIDNVFKNMAQYSDYLENFNLLVNRLDKFYLGKIFIQDEFFGYIPRAIWSNKPTTYGSLGLGLIIPELVEWTKSLTGAPSFGPLGQVYADFGVFGIFIMLAIRYFFAIFAKKYEVKLIKKYNVYDHLYFLTFAGCLIFYVTLTTFPIYQITIILLVKSISANRSGEYCKYEFID